MSDAFDPLKHKVYAVTVDLSYETYVVAEDQEEATEIASDNFRDEMLYVAPDFWADELTDPLRVSGQDLPWGANEWQGKQLTVNEAIALVGKAWHEDEDGAILQAAFDHETLLMPWADRPPPIWIPLEKEVI